MDNNIKIAVTSNSFSFNTALTGELSTYFPNVKLKKMKGNLDKDQLIEYLSDSDGAIIGLDQMTKEVIDKLPNLRIISKYGVGLDNLDIDYLKQKNIAIGWTPGVNRTSVSELTLGQMINLSRNIFTSSNELKNKVWNKNGGRELSELTIGIIGIGHIGQDLIKKLQVFSPRIIVNDIKDQSEFLDKYCVESVSKDQIFKEADIITIHTPKNAETANLINSDVFKMLKSGAIVICTARGGIVNEDDLYEALTNGTLKAAALDVYESEPSQNNKLHQLANFSGTPHSSGNSQKAILGMGREAIKHLVTHFKGKH
jgi:D-3-phosphoglycerate dehydrogenase